MKASTVLAATFGLGALALAPRADAYNWSTHKALVQAAVRAMTYASSTPAGATSEYAAFLAKVRAAPEKLALLRTGLVGERDDAGRWYAARPSGDPYPREEVWPFTPDANPGNCAVHLEDNLSNLDQFRIADLRYDPWRTAGPCALIAPVDGDKQLEHESDAARQVGDVLGWHAGLPDDCTSDSILAVRPTSVGFLSTVKAAADEAWYYGMGVLLTPFACLAGWWFGDGCDWEDGLDAAAVSNPVTLIEGWIPGIGNIRDGDYVGLWHFIHVDGPHNVFNEPRGMSYLWAGPTEARNVGGISTLDLGIIAATDFAGLSLDAYDAQGDDHYGQYDEVGRWAAHWQAFAIGHIEFSPLDNFARYGWEEFKGNGGTSAFGLGWPLHALGDASEPHHVTGTTGWGHRPYEDYVGDHESELVFWGAVEDVAKEPWRAKQLLETAFRYWVSFSRGEDMQALVTSLAKSTRSKTLTLGNGGMWAWHDGRSTDFKFGDSEEKQASIDAWASDAEKLKVLLDESEAAMIAFLSVAADYMRDPGAGDTCCPAGEGFDLARLRCVPSADAGATRVRCAETPEPPR